MTATAPAPTAAAWISDYLLVREREGRLYPDDLVAALPHVPADHPLADEWRQRRASSGRLLAYLRQRGTRCVVDLGCGNGWLSAALAALPGTTVVGVDANRVELAQARRVFAVRPNLRFVEGDIDTMTAPALSAPDAIVVASVVQYVADLEPLLRRLLAWLAPRGEVHILDSPFYDEADRPAAVARTRGHYASLGVPRMASAYHHHTWAELAGLRTEVRYDPRTLRARLARRLARPDVASPFPWLVIRPEVAA